MINFNVCSLRIFHLLPIRRIVAMHKHTVSREPGAAVTNQCACGVYLCGNRNTDKSLACNQPDGHDGDCNNTFYPEHGSWARRSQMVAV